jgi:hypothetical protein
MPGPAGMASLFRRSGPSAFLGDEGEQGLLIGVALMVGVDMGVEPGLLGPGDRCGDGQDRAKSVAMGR